MGWPNAAINPAGRGYSNLAPVSWLVQNDVQEGHSRLNFSEWGRQEQQGDEIGEVIRHGEMPAWYYVSMHPMAKLIPAEQDVLIRGLTAIAGGESGGQAGNDDD